MRYYNPILLNGLWMNKGRKPENPKKNPFIKDIKPTSK